MMSSVSKHPQYCLFKYAGQLFVLGTLFVLLNQVVLAQNASEPLHGPLIATNTLADDGFLFFDLTTDEARFLSFGPGTHLMGGFSPDGCQFVFTWERIPGRYDLFAAQLDGSNLRQLMFLGRTGALTYSVLEPSWSPDGSRIVFTLVRYYDPPDKDPYRDMHIAWVPPDSDSPHFYSASGSEWQPRWSPDGEYLAYVSEQPTLSSDEPTPVPENAKDIPTRPEVWVVRANGTDKYLFMGFTDGGAYNPRWSPTGDRIAFLYEPISNTHRIMVKSFRIGAAAVTLNRQLVTALDLEWQPDGQGIIAAVQGLQGTAENVLWRFSVDPPAQEATPVLPNTGLLYLDYPRYSPDGRWLAFRQAYELVVYDTRQGTMQAFGANSQHNSPPVWSPMGFVGDQACGH
jgi:Tol biopolymer transport system component